MKIAKFFKMHYPIFTFPFNWFHLNGRCILRLTCCRSIKLIERRARWITRIFNIKRCPTKIEEGSLKKKNFVKLQNAATRGQIISGNYVFTTLSYFLLEVNDRNQMKEMIPFIIMVLAYKLPMMKKVIQACKFFSVLCCWLCTNVKIM